MSLLREFSVFADIVISCFCDLRNHHPEAGSSMCPYDRTHLSQLPTEGWSQPRPVSCSLSVSQVSFQLWEPNGEKHLAFSPHPGLLRREALIWKPLPFRDQESFAPTGISSYWQLSFILAPLSHDRRAYCIFFLTTKLINRFCQ